jgi:Tol biopolymer transport system component
VKRDLPVWAPDSLSVFYTAKVGKNVELFRVTLDGKSEQLTDTAAGSMHYRPAPSPDGKWLVYGSKREGVRQLYVMRLSDKKEHHITDLKKGYGAMWSHWQLRAPSPDGKWLVYGSKREGVRQLYLMRLSDRKEHRITDLKKGHAAMWPSWQPAAKE